MAIPVSEVGGAAAGAPAAKIAVRFGSSATRFEIVVWADMRSAPVVMATADPDIFG